MPETTLPTEDRQLLALALAHLVVERPGWAYAVSLVAERLALAGLYETCLVLQLDAAIDTLVHSQGLGGGDDHA